MSNYNNLEGVIFDLDGVITKTARVHSQAWKATFDEYLRMRQERDNEPFKEFTLDGDYLSYVDGKPRYKGVESFLKSRGIDIPFGDPTDAPNKETVCGIGNRKNELFRQTLKTEKPEIYPHAIELVKALKKANVKVGVASSSKNCRYILESAGIMDLFETVVDGVVSAELGLKGKPEGDIFVKAINNLGSLPANAVVVEDASSGVAAGRNGGFELVVGVARKNNIDELLSNGADVVVESLCAIGLDWIRSWFKKTAQPLFKVWDTKPDSLQTTEGLLDITKDKITVNSCYFQDAKSAFFGKRKPVFFFDYDGTLTPIVERPELAVMSQDMRGVLQGVVKKFTTAVVSGRFREVVENFVKIEGIFYAGSHGFDIKGPKFSLIQPEAEKTIPLIAKITEELHKNLDSIEGLLVEEKKFSVAVHYRLVDEQQYLSTIKSFVEGIVKANPSLRLMHGKKVFEILPAIDWNKGKAIRWIMQALNLNWEQHSVIYIGDDTTDEDAFRTVRTRGTGILVSEEEKASCADFKLATPSEVKKLLEMIIKET